MLLSQIFDLQTVVSCPWYHCLEGQPPGSTKEQFAISSEAKLSLLLQTCFL
ncbi:hypothetical protein STEG23_030723, partial [Scotinomys teguina]